MMKVSVGVLLIAVLAPCACGSSETPALVPTSDAGTVVAISVAPNPVEISAGQSTQLVAVITNTDGSLADITTNPATLWSTNDPQIATVDLNGRVTGTRAGQTKINVFFGGKSTSVVVAVV
jgi:uncharacterized protein YjdB